MNHAKVSRALAAGLLLITTPGWGGNSDRIVSTPARQPNLAIAVYHDNLALIKDTRQVALEKGLNQLSWQGVPAKMLPESGLLQNKSAASGFRVQEQAFSFDLLTPAKLLEQYVGREIGVIRSHPTTGVETRESAIVLSANNGVVLQFPDRIETGVPGRLAFPAVPETLQAEPGLQMTVSNSQKGTHTLELTYLTAGVSWRADYVAELSANDKQLELSGWATLTNQSGEAFRDARLQLVAGNPNRVNDAQGPSRQMMMSAKASDSIEMQQESLAEYHLYTLERPITLENNQTKQVSLLSATQVPIKKTYLLAGSPHYYTGQYGDLGRKLKVGTYVEFKNQGDGLGVPLPQGVIRLMQRDSQGKLQFVGEDRVAPTPKNEWVRLRLGDAFDVSADRKQTDFKKLPGAGRFESVFESSYEIVLRNAKPEPVTVTVREPMQGDWAILSESHPHAKAASDTAEWQIRVPSEGVATLTYRARVRY